MSAITEVESGQDLIEALSALSEAWVSATGQLEAVELRVAGDGADPVRGLRGRWTLASLSGPVGGPYGVVLGRAADTGIVVVAGELLAARSLGVFVNAMSAISELSPRRSAPSAPAEVASPSKPAPVAQSQWADAVQAAAPEPAAEEEPLWPEVGDRVQHFAFGMCEVLMASDDRLKIRDLHGPGRIREIRAEVLRVSPPTERDGLRTFRLERKN